MITSCNRAQIACFALIPKISLRGWWWYQVSRIKGSSWWGIQLPVIYRYRRKVQGSHSCKSWRLKNSRSAQLDAHIVKAFQNSAKTIRIYATTEIILQLIIVKSIKLGSNTAVSVSQSEALMLIAQACKRERFKNWWHIHTVKVHTFFWNRRQVSTRVQTPGSSKCCHCWLLLRFWSPGVLSVSHPCFAFYSAAVDGKLDATQGKNPALETSLQSTYPRLGM